MFERTSLPRFCSYIKILRHNVLLRHCSTQTIIPKAEIINGRNLIFDEEVKSQIDKLGRVEKITITCQAPGYEIVMMMNKHLSTPFDCAKHISDGVMKASALAVYNDTIWGMHDPLPENGTLKFLNLLNPADPIVNTAYWRSCSFLMGALLDAAFKPEINVQLHSFPAPDIKQGCFFYIARLNRKGWIPTAHELAVLSAKFEQLVNKNLNFEKLAVSEQKALEIFQYNIFKIRQIPHIAKQNNGIVTLYRVGKHIDISKGPMIANTHLIGKTVITSVYPWLDPHLYSFQAVSIPKGINLNNFAFHIIEQNAKIQKSPFKIKTNRKLIMNECTDDNSECIVARN